MSNASEEAVIELKSNFSVEGNDSVYSLAVSKDERSIVAGTSQGQIYLWDLAKMNLISSFKAHKRYVVNVMFSSDSKFIISGGREGKIRLWERKTNQRVRNFKVEKPDELFSIAGFPDNRFIFAGGGDFISIWDLKLEERTHYHSLENQEMATIVTVSQDGSVGALGTDEGNIYIWDLNSWEQLLKFQAHKEEIHSLGFSPDLLVLFSAGDTKGARLWNVKNGKRIRQFRSDDAIRRSALSSDGNFALTSDLKGNLYLWDTYTGQLCASLCKKNIEAGNIQRYSFLTFSPTGRFALGSNAANIYLWDLGEYIDRS